MEVQSMSEIMPVAKQSPRIKNGVIYWYAGDAFAIDWEVQLMDDEGTAITFKPGDQLVWSFFSTSDKVKPVYTFTFNYDDIQDNKVTLLFSRAISSKFAIGSYTYCVKFIDTENDRVVTLNATNKVQVEACH